MADLFERLGAALAARYKLQRELGQGGMAKVFLAHDLKYQRAVAVKVLLSELDRIGRSHPISARDSDRRPASPSPHSASVRLG